MASQRYVPIAHVAAKGKMQRGLQPYAVLQFLRQQRLLSNASLLESRLRDIPQALERDLPIQSLSERPGVARVYSQRKPIHLHEVATSIVLVKILHTRLRRRGVRASIRGGKKRLIWTLFQRLPVL